MSVVPGSSVQALRGAWAMFATQCDPERSRLKRNDVLVVSEKRRRQVHAPSPKAPAGASHPVDGNARNRTHADQARPVFRAAAHHRHNQHTPNTRRRAHRRSKQRTENRNRIDASMVMPKKTRARHHSPPPAGPRGLSRRGPGYSPPPPPRADRATASCLPTRRPRPSPRTPRPLP